MRTFSWLSSKRFAINLVEHARQLLQCDSVQPATDSNNVSNRSDRSATEYPYRFGCRRQTTIAETPTDNPNTHDTSRAKGDEEATMKWQLLRAIVAIVSTMTVGALVLGQRFHLLLTAATLVGVFKRHRFRILSNRNRLSLVPLSECRVHRTIDLSKTQSSFECPALVLNHMTQ